MPSYIAPVEDMMFLFNKLRNNDKYNHSFEMKIGKEQITEIELLEIIGLDKEAEALEKAVQDVLNEGLRTKDILSSGMKEVSTSQMGDAIISKLQ